MDDVEGKIRAGCSDEDLRAPSSLGQAQLVEDVGVAARADGKNQIRLLDRTLDLLNDDASGEYVIGSYEFDVVLMTRVPERLLDGLVRLSVLVARRLR